MSRPLCKATEIALQGGAVYARPRHASSRPAPRSSRCQAIATRPGIYEYPFGVPHRPGAGRLRRARRRRRAGQRRLGHLPGARRIRPPHRLRGRSHRRLLHDFRRAAATCSTWRRISPISSRTRAAASARPAASARRWRRDIIDKIADGHGARYEFNELMRLDESCARRAIAASARRRPARCTT